MRRSAGGFFVVRRRKFLFGWLTFGAVFWLLCLPVLCEANAAGGPGDPITYFYKNPDLDSIPKLLRLLDAAGALAQKRSDSRPPTIGFFAALFERHPDRVDGWISGQYSREVQRTIGFALILAGMKDKAVDFLDRNGWSGAKIESIYSEAFSTGPNLLSTMPTSPSDLDVLWGASFATGDRRYPEKIIDFVDKTLNGSVFTAEGIMAFAPPPKDMRKLKGSPEMVALLRQLTPNDRLRLILSGVAVWGLGSNAVQHDFVMKAVQDRIAAAPKSDLSYMLRKSIFRQTYPTFAMLKGKRVFGIFSQSSALGVPKEVGGHILKNLDRPEASFSKLKPFGKNEFRMFEPVFVWGVLIVEQNETLDVAIQVTTPNGSRFVLDPIHRQAVEGENYFVGLEFPIEPALLTEEGVYTVNGVVRRGERGNLDIENHFFIGNR